MKIKVNEKGFSAKGTKSISLLKRAVNDNVRAKNIALMKANKKVAVSLLDIYTDVERMATDTTKTIAAVATTAATPRNYTVSPDAAVANMMAFRTDKQVTDNTNYVPQGTVTRTVQQYIKYSTNNGARYMRQWLPGEVDILKSDWSKYMPLVKAGKMSLYAMEKKIAKDIEAWAIAQAGTTRGYLRSVGSIEGKAIYEYCRKMGLPYGKTYKAFAGRKALVMTITL